MQKKPTMSINNKHDPPSSVLSDFVERSSFFELVGSSSAHVHDGVVVGLDCKAVVAGCVIVAKGKVDVFGAGSEHGDTAGGGVDGLLLGERLHLLEWLDLDLLLGTEPDFVEEFGDLLVEVLLVIEFVVGLRGVQDVRLPCSTGSGTA